MVTASPEKITPMLRQYLEVKERYGDAFVFFRVGDFYELFFDDAVNAASILNIALTSRDKSEKGAVPLCGVPHHAADNYVARMVREGHKVVLCDQVEDPRFAKGIVKREVVKVITPGTITDMESLDPRSNNYIVSISFDASGVHGVAFADVSCGELRYYATGNVRRDVFERITAGEIVVTSSQKDEYYRTAQGFPCPVSFIEDSFADLDAADEAAMRAVKLLKKYVGEVVLMRDFEAVTPGPFPIREYLFFDENSKRDLEIFEPAVRGGRNSSLLQVMDESVTSMGSRKIRHFLSFPLLDAAAIRKRLNTVESFIAASDLLQPVRDILKKISDLERLTGNLFGNSPCPKYLASLHSSLRQISGLRTVMAPVMHGDVRFELDEIEEVSGMIGAAVVDDPPFSMKDGGLIRPGHSSELDELKNIMANGASYLSAYEKKERERTGISSLKVGFNKIFGYYIEVSKANQHLVPVDFVRKQTLVNAERFITEELKLHEDRVLSASEKARELEMHLFRELIGRIGEYGHRISALAEEIALIDVFSTFAMNAIRYNYAKPVISSGGVLSIEGGRHPFVERTVREFVPNDTAMDPNGAGIMLITGPNMAGKSTYMRQVALIVIMAQAGSYVPASRVEMPVMDQIFTRIGTSDFLASGKSTFMVEMLETARILKESTSNSLVILDEVGRGTSTYDGMAIAWAVLEFLAGNRQCPLVLFSTHYHELTGLALTMKNIKNYNVAVKEWKEEIIFLHRLQEGTANRSYGIHVAKLAGLPDRVIMRAQEILATLENGDIAGRRESIPVAENRQMNLFSPPDNGIAKEIREMDINSITPLEAFDLLRQLRNRLDSE